MHADPYSTPIPSKKRAHMEEPEVRLRRAPDWLRRGFAPHVIWGFSPFQQNPREAEIDYCRLDGPAFQLRRPLDPPPAALARGGAPAARPDPAQAYSLRVSAETQRRVQSGETRLCKESTIRVAIDYLRLQGLDNIAVRRVLQAQIDALLPVDQSDASDRARDLSLSEGEARVYSDRDFHTPL